MIDPILQFARSNVALSHELDSESCCRCGRKDCDIVENPISDDELIAWAKKHTRPEAADRFVD